MSLNIIQEAKRCLHCKQMFCRSGCPIHTPIPDMITAFLSGDIDKAGSMLFENNPLSMICSLICDHENQCEGHCILNKKNAPVQISCIEHYISESYFAKLEIKKIKRNGKKVGIIGSGPAGITIAIILAKRGYDITIFESREKIGGVLRYGIPEFRLPKTLLDQYKNLLQRLGVKIRPNTTIGVSISVDDMFRDGYSAIFYRNRRVAPQHAAYKRRNIGKCALCN